MSSDPFDTRHACLAHGFSQTWEWFCLTSLQTAQLLPHSPWVPEWGCPTTLNILHAQDLMAQQKEQTWFSWVKKVTLGMDTSGGCPAYLFYGQYKPCLMCVVLSSAGMDGTAHAI